MQKWPIRKPTSQWYYSNTVKNGVKVQSLILIEETVIRISYFASFKHQLIKLNQIGSLIKYWAVSQYQLHFELCSTFPSTARRIRTSIKVPYCSYNHFILSSFKWGINKLYCLLNFTLLRRINSFKDRQDTELNIIESQFLLCWNCPKKSDSVIHCSFC